MTPPRFIDVGMFRVYRDTDGEMRISDGGDNQFTLASAEAFEHELGIAITAAHGAVNEGSL